MSRVDPKGQVVGLVHKLGVGEVRRQTPVTQVAVLPPLDVTAVAGANYPPTSTRTDVRRSASAPHVAPPAILVEKLTERCAFERISVRLYDAVQTKVIERGSFPGGPTRDELGRFAREELHHFQQLAAAVFAFGGDPSATAVNRLVIPGLLEELVQRVRDPRTSVTEALQALLVAALVDVEGWEALVGLCDHVGHVGLADRFEGARHEENAHLEAIRSWVSAATLSKLDAARGPAAR